MEAKVSIIIPVYNVEKYISRCLDSVVNQTYHNLEIIIVDDESRDNSLSICREYAKNDERIRIISQKNKGLSGARNTGIDNATGDYICFIDSDDWVEQDYVYHGMKIVEEKKVPLVVVNYYNSDDTQDYVETKGWLSREVLTVSSRDALRLLVEDVKINSHAWDKIYDIKLFSKIRFPEGKNFEDIFIMHGIFDLCDSIAISYQPKYHYYCRMDSIARDYKCKNILDYFESQMTRKDYLEAYHHELIPLQNTKLMELVLSYYPKFAKKGSTDTEHFKEQKKQFNEYVNIIEACYKSGNEPFTASKFKLMYKVYCLNKFVFSKISPIANALFQRMRFSKYKSIIKALMHRSEDFIENLNKVQGKRKILLIGVPEYENLGDVAIGYATKRFVGEMKSDEYDFLAITENNFWKYLSEIKKATTHEDIILIQGGGNFGDQYYDQERLRRKIIKVFQKNRIVLMPSTFYMKDLERNVRKYAKFYSKENVTLVARERYSYELLKRYFSNVALLCPDIVLSLPAISNENTKRAGVAVCFRHDIESSLNRAKREEIKAALMEINGEVYSFDTCINMSVPEEEQIKVLQKCWKEIASFQLVVTDKLHAMIFCVITGTPCVVFSNYNHKIVGVYEWLANQKYIRYIHSIEELKEQAEELLSDSNFYTYTGVDEEFDILRKIVKGY